MEVPYNPLTEVQGAKSLTVALSDATKAETSDILYHEVVDIPLPEMQHLKPLRLPKQSTVGDVINYLKTKWKFAFVSLGNPRYLQDSDVVSTRFENSDAYGAWEEYLGLEHLYNALKWSYDTNDDDGCFQSPEKEFTADL
ncbi:hypothetical protein CTI12_AA470800 [Artemisia annua]|uniref:Uncharacterized protein n=1 Tax=Artemisia annua TaxID=35608 RepID=A0A2U1LNW0_ARTAN|nr:hypothetical protein CTI12_AA470800 [Artemisia annua]